VATQPQIQIRLGRKCEIVSDERRQSVEEYADQLRERGYSVDLEVIEYEPGYRGISFVEAVVIYVLLKSVDGVLQAAGKDAYELAKRWARRRLEIKRAAGQGGRPVGFTIYDGDGEVLLHVGHAARR
jgi:hypothetical protein